MFPLFKCKHAVLITTIIVALTLKRKSFPYTPQRVKALYPLASSFWMKLFVNIFNNLGSARRIVNKVGFVFYALPTLDVIFAVNLMPAAAFQTSGKEPNPLVECFLQNCRVDPAVPTPPFMQMIRKIPPNQIFRLFLCYFLL
eukprot:Pompholyxophrys_punicea_v1_NODE_832_length_1230_cov_14.935374.p2 type:complete len:142 gc:universal NODE_832_length_1230_cov_14.935374:653-1078(+)